MILQSLLIENFRMFSSFSIPRLGKVNLIIGKNNAGKSSVLEAIHIFASQGSTAILNSIITGHDENLRSEFDSPLNETDDAEYAFRHFFPNRTYPVNESSPIVIGDLERKRFIKIEHKYYITELEEVADSSGELISRRRRVPVSKDDLFVRDIQPSQALLISNNARNFWFDLSNDSTTRRFRSLSALDMKEFPYSSVPTGFMEPDILADLWDRAALTELESYVIKALTIIDSSVTGLAFVKKETTRNSVRDRTSGRTAIVKLTGDDRPVPLNSMGDGMHRVLQLILAMFPARGGIFLIDEFENGLHYSVQEKVWSLIFQLATILDIQVFATTHSRDCIDAFAKISKAERTVEGVMFRISRGVTAQTSGEVIATVYDEEKLERLTAAEIELR